MNRAIAQSIVNQALTVGHELSLLTEEVARIEDMEEQKTYLRQVGDAMSILNAFVIIPIVKDHPDLDPDK